MVASQRQLSEDTARASHTSTPLKRRQLSVAACFAVLWMGCTM